MLTDTTILFVILGLQTKHFLADFVLQTPYMLQSRSVYGSPGGILHALVHALGSALVFLCVPVSIGWLLALIVGEVVVHYHIDWLKDKISTKMKLTSENRDFWIAHGVDQLLHQATYVAMIALYLHSGQAVPGAS